MGNEQFKWLLDVAVFAPLMWRAAKKEDSEFFSAALMAIAAGTFVYSGLKLGQHLVDKNAASRDIVIKNTPLAGCQCQGK